MTSQSLCEIELVAIDAAGRLLVRPRLPKADYFTRIYRDASGVEWDDSACALCAAEPERWQHIDLFKQICAAVRNEYGRRLAVTPSTQWTSVSPELQGQIDALAAQSTVGNEQ
jgi:hypothetical protein